MPSVTTRGFFPFEPSPEGIFFSSGILFNFSKATSSVVAAKGEGFVINQRIEGLFKFSEVLGINCGGIKVSFNILNVADIGTGFPVNSDISVVSWSRVILVG